MFLYWSRLQSTIQGYCNDCWAAKLYSLSYIYLFIYQSPEGFTKSRGKNRYLSVRGCLKALGASFLCSGGNKMDKFLPFFFYTSFYFLSRKIFNILYDVEKPCIPSKIHVRLINKIFVIWAPLSLTRRNAEKAALQGQPDSRRQNWVLFPAMVDEVFATQNSPQFVCRCKQARWFREVDKSSNKRDKSTYTEVCKYIWYSIRWCVKWRNTTALDSPE